MWLVQKAPAVRPRTAVTWGSRKELPCVIEVGTLCGKLGRKRDSEKLGPSAGALVCPEVRTVVRRFRSAAAKMKWQ